MKWRRQPGRPRIKCTRMSEIIIETSDRKTVFPSGQRYGGFFPAAAALSSRVSASWPHIFYCHTNIPEIYGWPDNDTHCLLRREKNPYEESEM